MPTVGKNIVAIDAHTHPQSQEFLDAMGARRTQMASHFKRERPVVSFDEMADRYRERNMMAVIVNSDDETQSGMPGAPNSLIGDAVEKHPDTFLGFAGVDPWKGQAAVDEVRRSYEQYGVLGVGELNPARQRFYPNDRRFYPLWEKCAELGLVVMFHCGFPGSGAGKKGGMGYKIDLARPVPYLDDVAADFPELRIIAAHPGWPWHLENLAACWHKSNYYIDLSGFAPKYIPPEVIHYANSMITDRVLFGSDWPVVDPVRWVREFDALDMKPASRGKIMLDNAIELFGLERAGS